MEAEYIDIDKESIPYEFDLELEQDVYTLDVRYNDLFDFFTIDLSKDGQMLVTGEKIVYGQPLFEGADERLPAPRIIPIDPSGNENTVTYENFNETVFLILDNGGEGIE